MLRSYPALLDESLKNIITLRLSKQCCVLHQGVEVVDSSAVISDEDKLFLENMFVNCCVVQEPERGKCDLVVFFNLQTSHSHP